MVDKHHEQLHHFYSLWNDLHNIQCGIWRKTRKDRSRRLFFGLNSQRCTAGREQTKLFAFRNRSSDSRYSWLGNIHLACNCVKSILANLDECHANNYSAVTYTSSDKTRYNPLGVLASNFTLELSDVAIARHSDLLAPTAAERNGCRSLLENILEPIASGQTARWCDMLVSKFGTLSEILSASASEIGQIIDDPRLPPFFSAVRQARLDQLRSEIAENPFVGDMDALIHYLTGVMVNRYRENTRILFLNSQNRLLADEDFGQGSVSSCVLQPRRIFKRALDLGATALIIAHNHPSGDPTPSLKDIQATQYLVKVAQPLDIIIHDHLIVAKGGWSSMRHSGIIG
jgi:DNA repair protein RadC